MLENLNTTLFLWVNALATPNPTILFIARIAADWVIYAVAVALIFGWIRGGVVWRKILFVAAISGAVALMINLTIASIYYHPRPFEIGLGHQFLAHAVETSFPSDHATVLFAIAFAILLNGGLTVWGGIALVIALTTAWARVYLGIHWPFDMAGSALIAGVVAILLQLKRRAGLRKLSEKACYYYDFLLDLLHLRPRA